MFDGKDDPYAHLREYRDKLVGVGRNEKLRMQLFIWSLSWKALTWYTRQVPHKWRDWQQVVEDIITHFSLNTEISVDRFSLVIIHN